jgi:hypothetical protein
MKIILQIIIFIFSPALISAQEYESLVKEGVSVEYIWKKPGVFEKNAKGSVLKLKLKSVDKICLCASFAVVLYEGAVATEKSGVINTCIKPRFKRRIKFLFEKETLPLEGWEWHAEEVKIVKGCAPKAKESAE